jgi:hypothetical protein
VDQSKLYEAHGARLSRALFHEFVLLADGWVQLARTVSLPAVDAAAAPAVASALRARTMTRRMRRII